MPISLPGPTPSGAAEVLALEDARALIATALTDDQLNGVISREEKWLASQIGQLDGERTQTFYPSYDQRRILLQRPTDSVVVEDNGVAVDDSDILLFNAAIERKWGGWSGDAWDGIGWLGGFHGPVTVTYTPNDIEQVKAVLIELVKLTLNSNPGMQSETTGAYSYTTSGTSRLSERKKLARSLDPHFGPKTMQLRSSVAGDGIYQRRYWP